VVDDTENDTKRSTFTLAAATDHAEATYPARRQRRLNHPHYVAIGRRQRDQITAIGPFISWHQLGDE
jgi:hypothetical protein